MSGLAGLVAVSAVIKSTHGDFKVGGLSLRNIASLLQSHIAELTAMFDGQLDLQKLLLDSPDFVAELIAQAAGEPDQVEQVKALPFGLQLTAVKKIWDLTAVDTEEMGKLFKSLQEATVKVDKNLVVNSSKTGSKS